MQVVRHHHKMIYDEAWMCLDIAPGLLDQAPRIIEVKAPFPDVTR